VIHQTAVRNEALKVSSISDVIMTNFVLLEMEEEIFLVERENPVLRQRQASRLLSVLFSEIAKPSL